MATTLLLGLDDAAEWTQWVVRAGSKDVYYLPGYARVWGSIEGGSSHLFVYEDENGLCVYPFRLRSLSGAEGLEDFTGCFDITSDYGYGGPVLSIRGHGESCRLAEAAFREFDRLCKDLHVVAEFCRFHPLLANHRSVVPVYRPEFCNQTAWMDLTLSEEEVWRRLRKGHRYDLRKAEKNRVEIVSTSDLGDSRRFYDLYLQTMLDVGAPEYYHFSAPFFESMMRCLSGNAVVFLANYGARTTGASIFLYGDRFFHYHFSGMDRGFQNMTPNKLLLYRAALWAKERGFVAFHLGGGYSGSDGDSLMRFKAGFTKLRADFYIGKRIHDEGVYREACRAVGVDPEKERFFPAYRAKSRAEAGADLSPKRQE